MSTSPVIRFSTCLSQALHTQLVKALRGPCSEAPEGRRNGALD